MLGGALIQLIAMEVSTFVEVTNVINHASAGTLGCFHITLTILPCATALACDTASGET
jgi:hypothetical protein